MLFTPHFDWLMKHSRMMADAIGHLGPDDARDVWDTLTGRSWPQGEIAQAIDLTMPVQYVALVRRASGVPATYYVRKFAELLVQHRAFAARNSAEVDDVALRNVAERAWDAFIERADLADKVVAGFGWDLSDAWETTIEVEEGKWARDVVTEIAELAGRMYNVMRGVRRRVEDVQPQEVKGVTLGGHIELILPTEHAQAASTVPEIADMARMRVLRKKALELKVAGDKPIGRGPLSVAIDESHSMLGHRNLWAKSCFAALARIAHEENRMVHCIHYSTTVHRRRVAPNDRVAFLQALACFLGGGTDIPLALKTARVEVFEMEKQGHAGADVVLVSDGGDWREEAIAAEIKAMAQRDVKLWTIAIDHDIEAELSLRKHAEHYVHVDPRAADADKVAKGIADAALGDRLR